MNSKRKIYQTEELTSLGLIDTSPRSMGKREKVEIRCFSCNTPVLVQFFNALNKFRTKGYSVKCKECLRKENSEQASKRTGPLNSFYGKKHSDEAKQKIKESRPEATKKARLTNIDRYGVNHPAQTEEQKLSQKETCQQKYGADSFLSSESGQYAHQLGVEAIKTNECKEKRTSTYLEKYGVTHYSKTDEFKEKLHKSRTWEKKHMLSTGEFVADICREYGKNLSNALVILRQYGEPAFWCHVRNTEVGMSGLEHAALDLGILGMERLNKKVQGLSYRPDFMVEGIFINTDGLYWHSELQKDIYYHFEMRQEFEKAGLRIMQFRQDEVIYKAPIVKSIIDNALGRNLNKKDARKCTVVKVSPQDAKVFFCENHLMGNRNSKASFGLYYHGVLISCLAVLVQNGEMEIARFSNKRGFSVRGAFSRLLATTVKEFGPRTIISYCDLRYATGTSYVKNGFVLEGISLGWQWTDGEHTFNRMQCRANMDERRLSQKEYALELGWYKIYDAGQAKYVRFL